ncbi:MAG: sigma-70 family RNA polymerase sigma factor [Chloroflexota bacterium]|nr:sigma-70 family RNA polymerase sigma factor [Chloroflexota bacterium]MDQ5866952.1 sigma-70 family RNA polymerase sigma factor [Chloroflexota bacterium]
MQESEAISRLKRGDISGLESLIMLYQGQALRVAYLTTRDYALAEDVVQASFLRAYERIEQFDSSKRFGPWFLRSVINSAITAVRNGPGQYLELQPDDEIELPSPDPTLIEMLERAETKSEILAALDKLPPKERAAIVMRYYLDWDDAEVSQRLSIPAGTVRRRLHDARRRLRKLLPSYRHG